LGTGPLDSRNQATWGDVPIALDVLETHSKCRCQKAGWRGGRFAADGSLAYAWPALERWLIPCDSYGPDRRPHTKFRAPKPLWKARNAYSVCRCTTWPRCYIVLCGGRGMESQRRVGQPSLERPSRCGSQFRSRKEVVVEIRDARLTAAALRSKYILSTEYSVHRTPQHRTPYEVSQAPPEDQRRPGPTASEGIPEAILCSFPDSGH